MNMNSLKLPIQFNLSYVYADVVEEGKVIYASLHRYSLWCGGESLAMN